jgi:hypothetical protein
MSLFYIMVGAADSGCPVSAYIWVFRMYESMHHHLRLSRKLQIMNGRRTATLLKTISGCGAPVRAQHRMLEFCRCAIAEHRNRGQDLVLIVATEQFQVCLRTATTPHAVTVQ